ncbi:heavy metal translocating P-type ATPase [Tunturiibacter gelidoferens]|uniref:Heavy metal translocating P-type ATPase n=1 Tax=Tunturiibacter gelidiferens TaxID=3069689 RepID=A0ACC5P3M2_9BACT|nr:cation-translocating P-type ATPase [Edaphobacter lichenicola]MBB5341407.1 heavy metal translocating P-type ATPase [Edaphobacter lichenicola]
MSVSSEQNTSAEITAEAHTNPHSACASCCEVPAEHDHEHGFEVVEVLRVVFVALAAAAVWFHLWEPLHRVSVIGLAATLIGGYPIFKEAFENVVERRMTMELSMTIALASALAIGEFFTALVITAFVLGAEILEGLTVGRGRRAIQDMLNFLPQTASVLRDGQTLEVATDTILPGEIVLIRPGSRIPVDGQVLSGHSFVEEAAITGEPMPSEKIAGSVVYAGAINQTGTLQVVAERLGKETTFGKIIEAVERAEHSRAPIQKTADRLAGYLVYFALGAALLTFLITHNTRATISVVIVAGACGIAAGTPLAILGAIGRAARQGSIIKGGIYLEALGHLDTVFLDKTGTLTYGMPMVTEISAAPGISEKAILKAAANAESGSEHPLGRAIVRFAEQQNIPVSHPADFEYRIGRGVLASLHGQQTIVGSRTLLAELGIDLTQRADAAQGTEVLVAQGGRYLGSILVTDQLRDSSAPAVKALTDMGIKVVLLTGDAKAVAEAVADRLGIIQAYSELLPEQKTTFIAEQVKKGRTVAMLGDGINDAPALSEATVGVAMGAGTDVARESADVVLIGNDLMKFVETVRIARNCRRIIFQNFYGTLIVDTVGIGLAAVGLLNPLLAAFIHVASELTFILNSTRLLPPKEKGEAASQEQAAVQV